MKSYHIDPETDQRIENIFQHHPPCGNQLARYKQLRDEAKAFAYLIISSSPKSREQALALTHLEQAVFFANAAIARHEKFDLEIQQPTLPVVQRVASSRCRHETPEPEKLNRFAGCYGGHDPNELPDSEEVGGDPTLRRARERNVIPA